MLVKFVIDLTSACGFWGVMVALSGFIARLSMKAWMSASICDGTVIVVDDILLVITRD